MDSANILLTEIALDLLGNKFYDVSGKRVYNLDTLYQLQNTNNSEENKDKKTLLDVLDVTEADLQDAKELSQEEIITLDDDEEDEFQQRENFHANTSEFVHPGKNSHNTEFYNSINKDDRLLFIQNNTKRELVDMRINSSVEKTRYLKEKNLLDDSGMIASAKNLSQFFSKEKNTLIAESGALMDFIKIIRNDETNSKDILRRVASDILLAKDMIC